MPLDAVAVLTGLVNQLCDSAGVFTCADATAKFKLLAFSDARDANVVTPTTFPVLSISGPPLDPGLMLASNWTNSR